MICIRREVGAVGGGGAAFSTPKPTATPQDDVAGKAQSTEMVSQALAIAPLKRLKHGHVVVGSFAPTVRCRGGGDSDSALAQHAAVRQAAQGVCVVGSRREQHAGAQAPQSIAQHQ